MLEWPPIETRASQTPPRLALALLLLALLFGAAHAGVDPQDAARRISIIPRPDEIRAAEGAFALSGATVIVLDGPRKELEDVAQELRDVIASRTSLSPRIADGASPREGSIRLELSDGEAALGPEGYRIEVTTRFVTIRAMAPAGVFYGVQTLRQMIDASAKIPCAVIEDSPRFAWRGMHLDVSRHFFPVADIKRFLDLMAMQKMNTFHWHLTDDGGWRVEIRRYPRLTGVGAWRSGDGKGWIFDFAKLIFPGDKKAGKVYGGSYTRAQIQDIVAYAARRRIVVVPEIEMPGHALGALDAYPELRCDVTSFDNSRQNVFCAGREKTFRFLENVLDEIVDLFPGPSIHIGGDEVKKKFWEACPKCRTRMAKEGLKNGEELQGYFIRRIARHLESRKRRLIGWEEIAEGGLDPDATVMAWRDASGGLEAARAGHDVVMSPKSHCYLDSPEEEGFLPLRKAYAFDPSPPGTTAEESRHILGGQGNVWTEGLEDLAAVEFYVFPRAVALAETLWTQPQALDWDDFRRRLVRYSQILDGMGVNYRISRPVSKHDALIFSANGKVEFDGEVDAALVARYTLDGTEPHEGSPAYTAPIAVSSSCTVKAANFKGARRSPVTTIDAVRCAPRGRRGLEPGLGCRYAEGRWSMLPDVAALDASPLGVCRNFDLKDVQKREDLFAVLFSGYIMIEKAGTYAFTLGSDDGSALSIAGARIVGNDGLHAYHEMSGKVRLERGYYPIEVRFFDGGYESDLKVFYEGPGISRRAIPDEVLYH